MNTITIKHNHSLSHTAVLNKVDIMLDDLVKKYQLVVDSKSNDNICFSGSGITGEVAINKNEIQVSVKLSFLMIAMKSIIVNELQKELDFHFS